MKLINTRIRVLGVDFNGTNFDSSFHFKTHLLKNHPKYPPKLAKVTKYLFNHEKWKLRKCLLGGHDFLTVSNHETGAGS